MAATNGTSQDPLVLLRDSIAANKPPIPTTSADPSTAAQSDADLAHATHLIFNHTSGEHIAVPLSQATRFISPALNQSAIDLRSAYFCWLHKDEAARDYIAETTKLNTQLQSTGQADAEVKTLVFVEKLDLLAYLEGEKRDGESEFIKPLDDRKDVRKDTDDVLRRAERTVEDDVDMKDASGMLDRDREEEKIREILKAERKMGDRNTVLRGIKIQDFSGVRKYSAMFLAKSKPTPQQQQQQQQQAAAAAPLTNNPALRPSSKPANPHRRPEPIILLSPSASSLLRMPNIKTFLSDGIYTAPESGSSGANMLFLTRLLPGIDHAKPLRFILVDSPDQFRPDYWSRVVAVFTTGQTWQFKNYKWQNPAELFAHALGVYVGWKGEVVPDTVKGWGRGVLPVAIDKGTQRWRDREIVEEIWSAIEARMRAMGWGKDGIGR